MAPLRPAPALAALALSCGGPWRLGVAADDAGCPWTPLRVVHRGRHPVYAQVALEKGDGSSTGGASRQSADNGTTTCEAFTNGACKYAVPFPGFDCFVNCVASEEDCARLNPHTVGINPSLAPHSCASCSITACAACGYEASGEVHCRRCFDGFVGVGGYEGHWDECILWHQGALHGAIAFVVGLLFCLVLTVVVTVCLGAVREFRPVFKRLRHFHLLGHDAHHCSEFECSSCVGERNLQAIKQGLFYSLTSSIKFSTLRTHEHRENSSEEMTRRRSLSRHILDTNVKELGLGLQLLFRSQLFFVGVAVAMWLFSVANGKHHQRFRELTDMAWQCAGGAEELERRQRLMVEAQGLYAEIMQSRCLVLWVVLVLGSWGFHWLQRHFMVKYDDATLSAQDYTIKLTGLPPSMTSEKRLKEVLERELRMEDKIHGVSICYNIHGLEDVGVDPDRIDQMIEHVVEADDLANQWCNGKISRPRAEIIAELQSDAEELKGLLLDGKLVCSGVAYVVFKEQQDMVQVFQRHRAIELSAFKTKEEKEAEEEQEMRGSYKRRLGYRQALLDSQLEAVAGLREAFCEPAGLRWTAFKQHPERFRKRLLHMTLRMLVYLGLYEVTVHFFYRAMVDPWQDHFIDGPKSTLATKLTGRLVLLFNFAIQSIVMFEVQHVGFLRIVRVDMITFLWATVLFLITNGYIIRQECFRAGLRWSLEPPASVARYSEEWWQWQRTSVQASLIERSVGENLVNVMMEQIMWLYVLGEVANVLLPVTRNWVALRLIYGPYLSGRLRRWALKLLHPLIPRCKSPDTVTAREAEKAQLLMPLLLWMEYTYIVVFTGMALVTFFFVTDESSIICGWLMLFSLVFYVWQRYVILWLYAPATYDCAHSYRAFIRVWGIVVSILPMASVWWAWRRGIIREAAFTGLMMTIVYVLAVLIYLYGIFFINWLTGERTIGVDDFHGKADPGYAEVMEENGSSWWNVNPIYVLKNRHCPDLKGHEVHSDVQCWPESQEREGFFELGKEFRHEPRGAWMRKHGKSNVQEIMYRFSEEEKPVAGAMLFRTAMAVFSVVRGPKLQEEEEEGQQS